MKNTLIISFFTLVLFNITSCGDDDYCQDVGIILEETVTFHVVDKNNGKDLFEELTVYDKDSVKLLINNIDILSKDGVRESYCEFQVDNRKLDLTIHNDDLYFLYFNYNDVDTIQMFTVIGEHYCLKEPQSEIQVFVYNGDTLYNKNNGDYHRVDIKK